MSGPGSSAGGDPAPVPAQPSGASASSRAPARPDAAASDRSVPDRLGPLVRDMQRALRSEFGSQSIYALLPAITRDRELRRLLVELRGQQKQHVEILRGVIESLGGRTPRSRWRRSVAAWALFATVPILGLRFSLRLCEEAAATVARWHAEYALHLAEHGHTSQAIACQTISRQRLAQHWALRAWTENFPSGGPPGGGGQERDR